MKIHEETKRLKELLDSAQTIAIFGHRNVDGDAIWSCLWLWEILEQQGKKISYWTTEEPSKSFDFVPGIKKFRTNFDYHPHYDLLIFCDTANPSQLLTEFRVGQEAYFEKMNTLNIDHHWSNTKYARTNYIDDTSSSASEYLAELMEQLYPDDISALVATYFFLWLSTDTGHFNYEKDSIRTFGVAEYLLSKWADKKLIMDKLYRSTTLSSTRFLGILINRITKKDWVIYSYYHQSELQEHNVDKEKADSILWIMTRIKHDGIFALIKFNTNSAPAYLKASLRSKWDVNVSEIAAKFGWWWHKAAAWLKHEISEDWENELDIFISEIQKF